MAAARTPDTPDAQAENSARANFIAAARKASQSASGGQPAASGAPEPEINDDTPRAAPLAADPAPRSRKRLLLGAALIVLAIGGAILAVPLVLAPSTSPLAAGQPVREPGGCSRHRAASAGNRYRTGPGRT